MGHWLNLQHVWGNGTVAQSCGDDGVADTPVTKGWQFCPGAEQSKVCNPDSFENYQNYMDYSSASTCSPRTAGQDACYLGKSRQWTEQSLAGGQPPVYRDRRA
ncbi:MAG: hypothetical protein IPI95_04815 [Flavobacteriales bacterium]|nr:hypothetical protein [Flavobacteriales bacterium]